MNLPDLPFLLKESFLRHEPEVPFVSSFGFELLKEIASTFIHFSIQYAQLAQSSVNWSMWGEVVDSQMCLVDGLGKFHDTRVPTEGNGKYFLSILRKCRNWCSV